MCGRSCLRQLLEMALEACAQRASLRAVGSGSRKHDEIPRWQVRSVTKRFARETLELVAVHGSFRNSTRDGQAEPSGWAPVRARENGEIPVARTRGLGEYSPELCRRVQSLVGREPCRVGEQGCAKTKPVTA